MDETTQIATNWSLIAGSEITKTLQTKLSTTEDFIRPNLDELIGSERAILLGTETLANQPNCEIIMRVFPKFKIESLNLICTSPKIEFFYGVHCEYVETVYGKKLDYIDDEINGFRYDVEIQKSGVTHLMLKLLTTSCEICVYGIQINVAPNPNGITTLIPNKINLDNVNEILSNSNTKLSPSAEKCKVFLQAYDNANSSCSELLTKFQDNLNLQNEITSSSLCSLTENLDNLPILKTYIDKKLEESEKRIMTKLQCIEEKQNSKLDSILKLLENNKNGLDS